jgi:formylglycine-generating enzyme
MHHTQIFKDNTFTFTMRHVEGGTFDMGGKSEEDYSKEKEISPASLGKSWINNKYEDIQPRDDGPMSLANFWMQFKAEEDYIEEKPVHFVSLGDFLIGQYPVTQALWTIVMYDAIPKGISLKTENHPIDKISWEDITHTFLPKLNEMTKSSRPKGSFYRLPTEAEWEYAAKSGTYRRDFLFKYSGSNKLNEVGWYGENSHGEKKAVGLKKPNLLGLYDMSGNVHEWCEDQWHDTYKGAPNDGSAWVDKLDSYPRILRGGGWDYTERNCRATSRAKLRPDDSWFNIGFRLVLSYLSV